MTLKKGQCAAATRSHQQESEGETERLRLSFATRSNEGGTAVRCWGRDSRQAGREGGKGQELRLRQMHQILEALHLATWSIRLHDDAQPALSR